jgi:hypothetical protein
MGQKIHCANTKSEAEKPPNEHPVNGFSWPSRPFWSHHYPWLNFEPFWGVNPQSGLNPNEPPVNDPTALSSKTEIKPVPNSHRGNPNRDNPRDSGFNFEPFFGVNPPNGLNPNVPVSYRNRGILNRVKTYDQRFKPAPMGLRTEIKPVSNTNQQETPTSKQTYNPNAGLTKPAKPVWDFDNGHVDDSVFMITHQEETGKFVLNLLFRAINFC